MNEKTNQNETIVQNKSFSQYLSFSLGRDLYGISVNIIREVNRYGKVFPVPNSPECVKGIINLRGDVIPIIDLNKRLFGKSSLVTPLTNIIILEVEEENEVSQIGAIIDSVNEVVNIADEDIENSPIFALNLRQDFVKGIGKVYGNFLIILNILSVLNADEISELFSLAGKETINTISA